MHAAQGCRGRGQLLLLLLLLLVVGQSASPSTSLLLVAVAQDQRHLDVVTHPLTRGADEHLFEGRLLNGIAEGAGRAGPPQIVRDALQVQNRSTAELAPPDSRQQLPCSRNVHGRRPWLL